MANGRDFRRAIDRLAADLSRIAEQAIAAEVKRAIALAIPLERKVGRTRAPRAVARARSGPTRAEERKVLAAQRRAEREAERARRLAEREAERAERETERLRRKEERDKLKEELKSARDAARQARSLERAKVKHESVASREARHRALTEKAATPPPLVVFKRSRDGQVTVLKPRPVEESGEQAATAAAEPAPAAIP